MTTWHERFKERRENAFSPLSSKDTSEITLYDLHKYYNGPLVRGQLRPIIGNEETRMTAAISWLIAKDPVIIRGPSGSGKSEILKATVCLKWGDDGVAGLDKNVYMVDATSDKGQLNQDTVRDIGQSTHCFIPELQNVRNQIDIIKKWTEGMPYVYGRTVDGGRGRERVVLNPLPIFTNLADGNEEMPDLVQEMKRRFISIHTRASKKVNTDIQEAKFLNDALPMDKQAIITDEKLYLLKLKMSKAMEDKRKVINPFIDIHKIIPKNYTESNTYAEYFKNFVKAITRFYGENRYGNKELLFTTAGDCYVASIISGGIFTTLSLGIPEAGEEILRWFPLVNFDTWGSLETDDAPKKVEGFKSADEVKQFVDETLGEPTPKRVIVEWLERMVEVGHLCKPASGKSYYKRKEFVKDNNIDWRILVSKGIDFMKTYYPEHVDEWQKVNITEYVHPFTGIKGTVIAL